MTTTQEKTDNPITDRVHAEIEKLRNKAKDSTGGLSTQNVGFAEIENIGPIKDPVRIPVPIGGGLLVLLGRNGSGKSTTLDTFRKSLGQDVKLAKNERAVGSGHFETPFGVKLKVSQTTRRTEEEGGLAVEVLDDEFQIGDLVDPREKDAAAADRRRLKALLRVAGAEADIADFVQLFRNEEEFERIVRDETRKVTDPVQMASMVKSDIEAEARIIEAEIKKSESELLRLEGALDGFDPTASEVDLEAIRRDHEQAVERLGALKRDRAAYQNAVEQIEVLQEREAAAKAAGAVDLDSLEGELTQETNFAAVKNALITQKVNEIRELQWQIEQMKLHAEASVERQKTIRAKIESARASAELLASIQSQLNDARAVAPVSEEDLIAAKERSEELARSIGNAQLIADKAKDFQRLQDRRAELSVLNKQATELRDSAKATDGVLTDMVKTLGTPVKVGYDDKGNPRLIVPHEGRDRDVYFSDLSKGERLYLVTSIAINAVGPGGMFVIPQEYYEGLDKENRARIAEQLKGTGVVAVTAQCSGGELRGEIYQPETVAAGA